MAESTDVLIQVKAQMDEALKNFKDLEKQIKTTKSTIDNQLSPSTDTMSNRVVSAGNKISGAGSKIRNAIGTESALAFGVAGTAALNFGKQCVQSAIASQQEWGRFNALLTQTGVSSDAAESLQKRVKNIASSMHRSVGDTREASLSFLQAGVSANQLESALKAANGVAARAGISQTEAATAINAALLGNGRQLKKLTGLRLEDYKTADGQIDKERLLNDLYNRNQGAIDQYSNSTEAKMNDMNAAWAKFKTSIGTALLPVVSILAEVATQVAGFFAGLDAPVQQFIAGIILVGGAVGTAIGALGMLAPGLETAGKMISGIGNGLKAIPKLPDHVLSSVSKLKDKVSAAKDAISGLELGSKITGIKESVISGVTRLKNGLVAVKTAIIESSVAETISTAATTAYTAVKSALTTVVTAATTAFKAFTATLIANPIILVVVAVVALVAILWHLYNTNEGVRNTINSIASAIKGTLIAAWNGLVSALQPVIQGLQEFWNWLTQLGDTLNDAGNSLSGIFMDALNSLGETLSNLPQIIGDALSNLGNSITDGGGLAAGIAAIFLPLPTMIFTILSRVAEVVGPALQGVWTAFTTWASGIVTDITTWFSQIPQNIMNSIMNLGVFLQPILQQLWLTLTMMFTNMVNGIIFVFIMLPQRIWMIFLQVAMFIWNGLLNAWMRALQGAQMVFNAIVNALINLPGRIFTIITNVANRVRSGLQTAANNAKSKAKEIYDGVVNKVKEIPGKVAEEFGKIPGKITSALASAASAAASGAASIVSSFLGALRIASPGIIQRKTTIEFNSLAPIIADSGVEAARATAKAGAGIVNAWENNMTGLGIPEIDMEELEKVTAPRLDIFTNVNDIRELMTKSMNREMIGTRINRGNPFRNTNTTNNYRTVNTDDHTIVYQIDNITLECGELTQAQSRQVLYNALEGLYPRGVRQ